MDLSRNLCDDRCPVSWAGAPFAECRHGMIQCHYCSRVWKYADEMGCIHFRSTVGAYSDDDIVGHCGVKCAAVWRSETEVPGACEHGIVQCPVCGEKWKLGEDVACSHFCERAEFAIEGRIPGLCETDTYKRRSFVRVASIAKRGFGLERATDGSAGYDLKSAVDLLIPPASSASIATAIRMQIPVGYFGNIKGRSGLAFDKDVIVFDAVIDSDYRGEIKIKLFNLSRTHTCRIVRGDRVAQILFISHDTPNILYVSEGTLPPTARGSGGFGSSGK